METPSELDQLILASINPFDSQFSYGNFWQQTQNNQLTVSSIHQDIIQQIELFLKTIHHTHETKTLLLGGDSGSGKSYLLGRLKKTFNTKAFFVYIGPWADSQKIWKYILHQTVNSLLQIPEGQKENQLLLWLKSLPIFQKNTFKKWLLGERTTFIQQLRTKYNNISYPHQFFGLLYDLTNPELYQIAADWLKGEELPEEQLKKINLNFRIDNEETAKNILNNLGIISIDTLPIVLCFDQLDNIPLLSNGDLDLATLLKINSIIHNQSFKNFLIIISIKRDTWNHHHLKLDLADRARINYQIALKKINQAQIREIWKLRIASIHQQLNNQPHSEIAPLSNEQLIKHLPSKTDPRNAIIAGRTLWNDYKLTLVKEPIEVKQDYLANFKLIWHRELQKVQTNYKEIKQFDTPSTIKMLSQVLAIFEKLQTIRTKLLSSQTFSTSSLSFINEQNQTIAIVWIETQMNSFSAALKNCQQIIKDKKCDYLYLIRHNPIGNSPRTEYYKIYQELFKKSHKATHIKPNLNSLHYLVTYNRLINSVLSQELLVIDQILTLTELHRMMREAQILDNCQLLQDLSLFTTPNLNIIKPAELQKLETLKDYLYNLVKQQKTISYQILIEQGKQAFTQHTFTNQQIQDQIETLCQENKIKLLQPQAKPENRLISLII